MCATFMRLCVSGAVEDAEEEEEGGRLKVRVAALSFTNTLVRVSGTVCLCFRSAANLLGC